MDASVAIEAGKVAHTINELTSVIADCKALAEAGACFTGKASITDPIKGRDWIEFPAMSVEESAAFFAGAIGVFEARLAALSKQLAAM